MDKLDLIIKYLDSIGEVIYSVQGLEGVERLNKARTAARTLRALNARKYVIQQLEKKKEEGEQA